MIDLIGKIVEIETVDMTYAGKLIEVGEDEVHIEAATGWVIVPLDKIAFIREKKD
jgi:hypothetical protein